MDISDLMLKYTCDPEKGIINNNYIEEVVARLTKAYYEKWNNMTAAKIAEKLGVTKMAVVEF